MFTILLRLLMIQMAIQFSLTVVLEGQTSHYVNLLDSPVVDPSAKRITCPVYSIRPADNATKFIKYAASQAQFAVIGDWEERTNALTFKDCASAAATNEDKMFLFDDGACTTSKTLFVRLPETCGDENAVIVYMVESPQIGCAGEYIWWENDADVNGTFCDAPADVQFTCYNGIISGFYLGTSTVYFSLEEGCYNVYFAGSVMAHSSHGADCSGRGRDSCVPADAASRPAFNQNLKVMAAYVSYKAAEPYKFIVDCNAPPPGDTYLWGNNVEQPTDVVGEWNHTYPTTDDSAETFVYASEDGLVNGIDEMANVFCCYKAN